MNWCLIKHKWNYNQEDIFYERFSVHGRLGKQVSIGSFLTKGATIPTDVRLCKRCYKKQRLDTRGYWVDWDLTKEEERDIRLKELGI